MNYTQIGQNVRTARKRKHLTQGALAEAANVSTVFICQIETGARYPSLETLYHVSLALNTTIDSLIGENDKQIHTNSQQRILQHLAGFSEGEMELAVKIAAETLKQIKNTRLL